MKTNDYPIPPNISLSSLLVVLKALKNDARNHAIQPALSYCKDCSPSDRANAMYYLGKEDLLKTLIWGLGGEAEEDGIGEPTINAE